MTVINGIEIGMIKYIPNKINEAIKQNKMICNKLHVIIVISNPCKYFRRYILALEFIKRIKKENNKHIELYVVELEYENYTDISNNIRECKFECN